MNTGHNEAVVRQVGAEARSIVAALRGALPWLPRAERGAACCPRCCRRVRPMDRPATDTPRGRLSLLARSITLMTRVEERPPKQDFALQQVT